MGGGETLSGVSGRGATAGQGASLNGMSGLHFNVRTPGHATSHATSHGIGKGKRYAALMTGTPLQKLPARG